MMRRLMRLQSWLSPAFPIGAYSYSHGLEWAVESGAVRDRVTLVDWLEADLRFGTGRTDGIFLAETWRSIRAAAHAPGGDAVAVAIPGAGTSLDRAIIANTPARGHNDGPHTPSPMSSAPPPVAAAAPDLLAIAEHASAMRGTSEFALESGQQGTAFLGAVRKAWPHPALDRLAAILHAAGIPPVLPVAAGIACAVHDIALEMVLPLYLHAGVANLINAAVRLIPLGQTDGQIAMAALEAAIAETAGEALVSGISEIGSAAFMIDIASMQHETQYTRLFRS